MSNGSPAGAELQFTMDGHVAVITLNRPERMNAINEPMLAALAARLVECGQDPAIRVVVLTGAGRGFCAGLDLIAEHAQQQEEGGIGARPYQFTDVRDAPPLLIHRLDKPVICALNGPAAGYGMDLALMCDLRIASSNGKLAAILPRRGALPANGGTWILPRLVGWHRAMEVALRGRVLNADELLALGLVNRVVPHNELLHEVMAWAHEIAANAPLTVQATKRMMRMGLNEPLEVAFDHAHLQILPLLRSADFKEGVAAYIENREPRFQGR